MTTQESGRKTPISQRETSVAQKSSKGKLPGVTMWRHSRVSLPIASTNPKNKLVIESQSDTSLPKEDEENR